MIKATLFLGSHHENGDFETLFTRWNETPEAVLWIDNDMSNRAEALTMLESFNIHPLAIEDAFRDRHPPKIELFESFCFIVYRGILSVGENLDFQHLQMGLFIGERFLITTHKGKSIGIDTIVEKLAAPKKYKIGFKHDSGTADAFTSFGLALNIMHASSTVYLDNILSFESLLADLEDQMQNEGSDQLLTELTFYKSRLIKLRRVFSYHCGITEVLRKKPDEGVMLSYEKHEHTTNDLHDRFDRLHTLSQMHYDICGDLIEGYISISSHRLNVTMRILTVITAVFVPLSFLAGLYGMNFEHMPELKFQHAYYVLLASMVFVAIGLLSVFKRKKWL